MNTPIRQIPVTDYADAVGSAGQLIDVREPHEYAEGSLPGAVNIPLGELPDRVAELDAEQGVVLLCRSGGRSQQAAEYLHSLGYDTVNLVGGMSDFDHRRR